MARGRKVPPRSPEMLTPEEKRAATMKKIEERQRMLSKIDEHVKSQHESFNPAPRLKKPVI
jgi:hypothetical protein